MAMNSDIRTPSTNSMVRTRVEHRLPNTCGTSMPCGRRLLRMRAMEVASRR